MNTLRIVVCASIGCVATAQQLTVAAATPLTVSAQNAGTTTSNSIPAGPLASVGWINASSPGGGLAQANVVWQVEATPISLSFDTWQMATVLPQATAPASASAGPHEYLLHLTSPSPMSMLISAHRWFDLFPASPLPQLQVDVLDDGVPEFVLTSTQTGPSWPIAVVTTGPLPVPIRVRLASLATAGGTGGNASLRLTATPNNGLDISRVVIGCSPSNALECHPSFVGTGVDFWASSSPFYPSVLVLGLGPQPVVFPTVLGVPCILGPSPDLLVLVTPSTTMPFTLPLPPAVRPVTVYAQVVQLPLPLLFFTDAFRVAAY